MRSHSPQARQRLAMVALLVLVGAVTLTCIQSSLAWIGRPFNGFLLARNRIVVPVGRPAWSGTQAGVPYRGQLIAVNGEPIGDVGQVLAKAERAGAGETVRYTFVRDGKQVTLAIGVITFTLADYIGVFGNHLLNGLTILALGFIVVILRPGLPEARAMLLFSLSSGLALITSLEDFATYRFRDLMAVAQAAAPASLLYLASRFPTEHRWLRGRTFFLPLIVITATLASVDIVLYDRAPAAWMRFSDSLVVWITCAVLLSVALMSSQYRSAANPIVREKIKIVLLGAVVAFAFPAATAVAGDVIGAPSPFDVFFALTWVLPAALAYAIVKQDLFEIDDFLRRAASTVALCAAVFCLCVAVVAAAGHVLGSVNLISSPWFTLLFSLVILAIARPLHGWLQAGVDRLFFRTRFDHAAVTESLSQELTRTLNGQEITAHVQRVTAETMAPTICMLFMDGGDGRPLRCADPAVADLRLSDEMRTALATGPILHVADVPALDEVRALGATLLLPLRFEGQLQGLLLLGPKKSGAVYGSRDLELLQAIGDQTATALRNASSYGRVSELLSSLEARVEERTRELQETQAELQASNEKLRELDRLKTQFFAEASHELRTPLTLVLGPLEQLRRQASTSTQDAQRLLDLAHSNSAKLLVLTDTLLDLSRLDAGRMQPTRRAEPLGPLLERAAEPFRWLAEQRGVNLSLRGSDLTERALCDAGMVSKIIGNLLANALKFTSSGEIEVAVEAGDGRVGIRVSDSGPGIPAAELPHIFERYRQASTASRSTVSGSGLGLALVRELTHLQDGSVEVYSEEGRGTTFVVWLPALADCAGDSNDVTTLVASEIASSHLEALAAAGKVTALAAPNATSPADDAPTVLVVDDNLGLLDFVSGLLAAEYRVRTATNATDALAVAQMLVPDIILCDVMMPGPDGVTFCQTLKQDENLRHIPLILLTARASLESKVSGLAAGADDYITKPFHPEELKARMSALLRLRQTERELSRSYGELTHAYDQLRRAQAQLIQSEKMASIGTLVAGIAHEINNPVSFINSSIDLISTSIAELREVFEQHLNGNDSAGLQSLRADLDYEYRIEMLQQNAAICSEGASRAARIVGDLRSFCRPGTGKRELADLHDSLDQSLRLLQGECKGRVNVHRDYGHIPKVECDKGQIGQVFVNLLANAIQAIDGTGDVFVRTRSENGSVTIEIEDTGRGMPDDVASRVFDPFFTTKEVGKGTGLGLSIVRSLVSAHGGDIEVRSTVGRGSLFTVKLSVSGDQHE